MGLSVFAYRQTLHYPARGGAKIMHKTILAVLIAASIGCHANLAFAADPKAEPPTIPTDVQAEIAWTQLDAQLAREASDKAQAAAQAALAKATAACGEKYTVNRVGGKLLCVAKPEAPKPEAKK
jgi:hypothetical protein